MDRAIIVGGDLHIVDEAITKALVVSLSVIVRPLRQWVLAPPFALVGLLGARHDVLSHMCRIFSSAVFRWYRAQARASGVNDGRCGAVTFIQRFSTSLLLYPHFHVAVLDGVYTRESQQHSPRFIPATAPTETEICTVAERVAHRMARLFERLGLVDEADECPEPTALDRWYAGIHREPADLAVVDPSGKVAMRTQEIRTPSTGEAHGFSVHARVQTKKGDAAARERLVRYAARPPLADAQLSETPDGRIAVALRKPRCGQTHIVFEPLRLLRRLAWLIPLLDLLPSSDAIRYASREYWLPTPAGEKRSYRLRKTARRQPSSPPPVKADPDRSHEMQRLSLGRSFYAAPTTSTPSCANAVVQRCALLQ